jgi:hypothetical protein
MHVTARKLPPVIPRMSIVLPMFAFVLNCRVPIASKFGQRHQRPCDRGLAALEGRPRAAALLAGHADALYALRHHTWGGRDSVL